jgi:hypothetical protein
MKRIEAMHDAILQRMFRLRPASADHVIQLGDFASAKARIQ